MAQTSKKRGAGGNLGERCSGRQGCRILRESGGWGKGEGGGGGEKHEEYYVNG